MAAFEAVINIIDGSDDEDVDIFNIDNLSDVQIFQRTRLNREMFVFVVELLTPILQINEGPQGRRTRLSIPHRIYVALQFFASGGYQWLVGTAAHDISQSTASKCISTVTDALVEISNRFIKFPTPAEYPEVKRQFFNIGQESRFHAGFPNVIGAIDCTHVLIYTPVQDPDQYVNRNFRHSINTQIICGPETKIYNVIARFPGGNHDSYIWRNCTFRELLVERNFVDGWLIGDSGYPLESYLMNPILQPRTPEQHLYNSSHIQTRNVIERVNGILKGRFRCLNKKLKYSPARVCSIIVACCVLHNICLDFNVDVEEEVVDDDDDDDDDGILHHEVLGAADVIRNNLLMQYFIR